MCGIVGILTEPQGGDRDGYFQATLRRMMAALRHRGPDGEGVFLDAGPTGGAGQQLYLGHRRLDILAPGLLGAQPMTDASQRYTLSFNGAIYNFVELARELGMSGDSARSDSAVLLEAWAAWGTDCLARLNGMYAFALWDRRERALYLCRDRYGEKPLHYAAFVGGGTRLLFASEVKGLFASGLLRPRIDGGKLAEFLATHDIDHRAGSDVGGGNTLFEGIRQVPAGCYLRIEPTARTERLADSLHPIRYYSLHAPEHRRQLNGALVEEVKALLSDAVSLRLRSDVPIGGSLSGGLDSSLLTGLATRASGTALAGSGYRVFMAQFPDSSEPGDETAWAEQVVGSLGLRDAVRVMPTAGDFTADLERVLFHQEAPFADTSICAHFALMRAVRESGVKVLLSGQGGDEVFAGYGSYYYALLGSLLGDGDLPGLWRNARARAQRTGDPVGRLLAGAAYHALPGRVRQHLYKWRRHSGYPLSAEGERRLATAPPRFGDELPALCSPSAAGWPPFDRYLLDCMARWSLPHILRHDDRNSMAFGLESRAPYLDYRLTELLLTVAPVARIGDGYTKRLLREVATGILPEAVRLRVDKRGFFSPQCEWLWASEEHVRAACDPLPAGLAELTDGARLTAALDGFFRGRRRELSEVVWSAMVCGLFLGRVVPRLADAGP